MIYGYVRVSTVTQNLQRQINSIKTSYPDAAIIKEEFTGKTMDRPSWNKLYKVLKKGDIIVFDEVSRMSRNAEEGFKLYQELFDNGIKLVFLKEPYINTDVFSDQIQRATVNTGKEYLDQGLRIILMGVAEEQIKIAFSIAQIEIEQKKERQKGGIKARKERNAQLRVEYPDTYKAHTEYRPMGREKEDKLHIKKADPIKDLIREYSRDFNGHNTDAEVLAILRTKIVKIQIRKRSGAIEEKEISAKLSRNTLYKYKGQMKDEMRILRS